MPLLTLRRKPERSILGVTAAARSRLLTPSRKIFRLSVVADAHLATWTVTGPGLAELAETLKHTEGVDMVAPFGAALHVSGRDAGKLEGATRALRERGPQTWAHDEPTLEDVFIDLMSRSRDNFE